MLSNLYVLCPQLITEGIVHLMAPPLFGVYVGKWSKTKQFVYLRNAAALALWKCSVLYRKQLDIEIRYGNVYQGYHLLDEEEYEFFIMNVVRIGEKIRNLASELVLDPLVVEHLALITPYLDNSGTKEEAGTAVVNLSDQILKGNDGAKVAPKLIEPLEKVAQVSANADLAKRAKALGEQAKSKAGAK